MHVHSVGVREPENRTLELTEKSFVTRLEALQALAKADAKSQPEEALRFQQVISRLHEKGVECAIVVPLLEIVLDFDAMDIGYEQESTSKHGQRFDFLLEGKFLVECKALGANLDEHRKQISRYIQGNNEINYGLLTNGIDYQFWIQKTYLEKVAGSDLRHTDAVACILELSLQRDNSQFLLDAIRIFSKKSYVQTFEAIASVAGYYAAGSRGKPRNVHEDRKINEELRERIRSAVVVTKGVFYDDVVNGKLAAGTLLRFADDCVSITVEVTETGTVILRKGGANVLNMVLAMKEGWEAMIPLAMGKWLEADTEFQDPLELIKIALNRQRLTNKERYIFRPTSS